MNILRAEYIPGLSNASMAELIHAVDGDHAASPRERALADALNTAQEEVDAANAQAEKAWEESSHAEAEVEELQTKVDEMEEANDALRESLRALLRLFGDTPEVHIFDTPEDAASSEHRAALDEARDVLAQFPSEAEKRAEEAHQKALKEAAVRELEARLPGFAALEGAPARIEYKVPRGRKWHVAKRASRMNHRTAAETLARIPAGSVVRIVEGY